MLMFRFILMFILETKIFPFDASATVFAYVLGLF